MADRFNTMQMGLVAANRIFELLEEDKDQELDEWKDPIEINSYHVRFEDVRFGYSQEKVVLKGISFQLEQGKTLAIVGKTGAGKSTIINLISKLYPNFDGNISIGGISIHDFDLKQLRNLAGVVMQDVFVFSGTLRENIDLAGEFTDNEILKAIHSLGLDDLLLPKGLDYKLGERGSGLSLGEKQLISFVRAVLLNPPILILDEATSSIDPATEQIIQATIPKLTQDRTSIIIAHRLSTIEHADDIIYLDDGLIIEQGNHETLLAQKGVYAEMVEAGIA